MSPWFRFRFHCERTKWACSNAYCVPWCTWRIGVHSVCSKSQNRQKIAGRASEHLSIELILLNSDSYSYVLCTSYYCFERYPLWPMRTAFDVTRSGEDIQSHAQLRTKSKATAIQENRLNERKSWWPLRTQRIDFHPQLVQVTACNGKYENEEQAVGSRMVTYDWKWYLRNKLREAHTNHAPRAEHYFAQLSSAESVGISTQLVTIISYIIGFKYRLQRMSTNESIHCGYYTTRLVSPQQ